MEPNQTTTTGTTGTTEAYKTDLGLAVGVTLALVAVAVAVAVVITVLLIRRFRSANISQPAEPKITVESVHNAANPRYISSVVRPPPTQQDPVYENIQSKGPEKAQNTQCNTTNTSTHGGESHAEDLYLQCDPQEDAIYNNGPSFFHYSKQPDSSCENEYIMPDMP